MARFQGEVVRYNPPTAGANDFYSTQEEPLYDRRMGEPPQTAPAEQGLNLQGLTPAQVRAAEELDRRIGQTDFRSPLDRTDRGLDYLDELTRGAIGQQDIARQELGDIGRDYLRGYQDRGSYTMGSLETQWPELYERERAIEASRIDPYMERIGTTGIDTADIQRFQDPYMRDVVDTSLADYDEAIQRSENTRRARQAGAGAFGGREGLYEAALNAESARQRAGLGAGLRSQGYQQALAAAQREAELGQRAEQLDQATWLTGGRDQLMRDLEAQRQTAANIMDRKRADIAGAYQGDEQRMRAIRDRINTTLGQAGLGSEQARLGDVYGGRGLESGRLGLLGGQLSLDQLQALYNMGTGQFRQPLDLLGLGTQRFGQRDWLDQESTLREEEKKSGSTFGAGFAGDYSK